MLKHPAGLLFLAFLALYLLTMGGHLYSPDEEIMFLTTRSLAEHGSLAIEPPADFGGFATRRGLNRREYGQYGVGQPLLAVPFYMLGRALADHFGDRPIWFSGLQSRGQTPRRQWERFGVSLFNQFIAALLVALLFALAHDLTGDKTAAALTAILYGAGTMAWVHSKPFFSETLATVMVFSAFSLLVRARLYHRPRWFTLAGCAAGYALLTRLDSLFAFPALGLLLLWPDEYITYIPPAPRPGEPEPPARLPFRFNLHDLLFDRLAWQRIGRFAPPVALACVIILGLNWSRYGSPFSTGYEDQPEGVQFINPLLVGLYGFFFSVGKGIFFFSPPLVLFCFAIRRFVRLSAPAGWAVVVLLASLLLIQSKWINWAGGWCWGPRHVFMVHVFFALPICALLMAPRTRVVRVAYAVLLVCGVAVQLYGTSQNFIDFYYVAFRSPFTTPRATVRYDPMYDGPLLDLYYEVKMKANPLRSEAPVPPWQLPAPVTDSVWRMDNSQWVLYREMLRKGYHDYFWLERLGCRSYAHEVAALLRSLEKEKR